MLKNNKEERLIGNKDETIILLRSIFCSISFSFCFILMVVYFILCLQVKCNILVKNKNRDSNAFTDDASTEGKKKNKKANKEKKKIGLGSNFMFLLTISNFFGSLFEFLFYFYYIHMVDEVKKECNECILDKEIYKRINEDGKCRLFGFAHNFFDLFAVCWTIMLTLLFYRSTDLSNEMLYKDTKYLLIGFLFSFLLCFFFCAIPYMTKSFGFARYYCSFKYREMNEDYSILDEKGLNKFWRYSFVGVTFIGNALNVLWLFLTTKFYSKKLAIIKKQNKNEYKLMLIYVWVFRIFPIVLVISRIFKGLSRIVVEKFDASENAENIIEYINAFLFASNGIFCSIACIFFFKGVFWCCWPDTLSNSLSEEDKECSDMNYLGSDLTED